MPWRDRFLLLGLLATSSCAHFDAEARALGAAKREFPRCHDFTTSGLDAEGLVTVRVCGVPVGYLVTPVTVERVR